MTDFTYADLDYAAFEADVRRRSRRAGLIGLSIAGGVAVLCAITLALLQAFAPEPDGDGLGPADIPLLLAYLLVLLMLGAGAGLQVISLSLSGVSTAAAGPGRAGQQVRRIVFKGQQPTDDAEARRASAYASLATILIPQQTKATTLVLSAMALNLLAQLLNPDTGAVLHVLELVLLPLLIGTTIALTVTQRRNAQRARTYRPNIDGGTS